MSSQLTTGANKKSPVHGGGVRGADLSRRSSQFEGRFGRILRNLPAAQWPEAALRALGQEMTAPPDALGGLPIAPREDQDDDGKPRTSRLHDDEENSGIPAGYTYLGQFIDHDITFDPASSLQQQNDVDGLIDFRTPRLDLDSVYGRGPADQPYMYDPTGRKFALGRDLHEGFGGKVIAKDLPRFNDRALIGDKRNDENVIVSQLHSVMLQFHNRLADKHPEWTFADVQRSVRWHYQYAVLNDFLGKMCRKDVLHSVLPHLGHTGETVLSKPPQLRFYKPKHEAFIPIEFSAAAYRFGHSMVRPIYRLNQKLKGGENPEQANADEIKRGIDGRFFIFAGLKGRGLNGFGSFPVQWGIDWSLFFDFDGKGETRIGRDRVQPSYKIDSSLVNPLGFLPEFSKVEAEPPLTIKALQAPPKDPINDPAILALRNLMRGMSMSLPSGQAVAMAMGLTPLTGAQLKVGKAVFDDFEKLPSVANLHPSFVDEAPLWFYMLAESQREWFTRAQKSGKGDAEPASLGEVGSRIVAETLVGLLLSDGRSYLNQAPAWKPTIGKKAGFDAADLVKFALGVA